MVKRSKVNGPKAMGRKVKGRRTKGGQQAASTTSLIRLFQDGKVLSKSGQEIHLGVCTDLLHLSCQSILDRQNTNKREEEEEEKVSYSRCEKG
jgi:hypothetical protein